MEKGDDPYRILGLYKPDVDIDPSSVKRSYLDLATWEIANPDSNKVGGSIATTANSSSLRLAKIKHAYKLLKHEKSKREYDLLQSQNNECGYDPVHYKYHDRTVPKCVSELKTDENKIAKESTAKISSRHNKTKKKSRTTPIYAPLTPTTQSKTTTEDRGVDSTQKTSQTMLKGTKLEHITPRNIPRSSAPPPTRKANLAGCYRSASKTMYDTKGNPKTFAYKRELSDGTTTVEVKSPRETFSWSVKQGEDQGVYDLFKDQFGMDEANKFFERSNDLINDDTNNDKKNKKTKAIIKKYRSSSPKSVIDRSTN